MRILMISDVYFPRINGVSTSIQTFAHEFIQRGHQVTLIAPAYPSELEDDFEVIRVPSRYLPMDPEDRMMSGKAIKRLLAKLDRRDYDLIHIQTPFVAHYLGTWLSRRLGIPCVETYHTYFEEYLDKYLPWIPRRWLRFAARRFTVSQADAVDRLVVPTKPMAKVLVDYGLRQPPQIIPTGLPERAYTQGVGERFREAHGIAPDRQVLLYVGRVAHEKNIEFLIRVAERLSVDHPQVLLVIAGEGPARKSLQRLVDERGLQEHVRFVGYLDRANALADCYCAADVFVFASRTETQGLVLLEAMAVGTPVVSTAVMGTAEIMADRLGGLVAEDDEVHFADQVSELLDNPLLAERLRREALSKAQLWSAPATAAQMLALYRELTGETDDEDTEADTPPKPSNRLVPPLL